MFYSLKSTFVITILTLSLVVQSAVIENSLNNRDQLQEYGIGLPALPGLPGKPSPKTFADQLKPLFPPFGSLTAPRLPTDTDPMGHGPLSEYSIKYLSGLSLDEARKLKDKLIRNQLGKHQKHEENVRFMYLLDEALYDAGIALDFNIRDIMFKLDLLSHHEIKALAAPDLFTIKKSAKDISKQILRRYLTLSQLNFIKRYIDLSVKNILEIDGNKPK